MGRLIKQGLKGADVRAVQDVLNFHIRRLTPLEVDGDFGPLTHARVVEFQKSNQLKPDGIVGPNTMAKLFEEEQLPITLVLAPRQATPTIGAPGFGIQPPRLIPPLTLPPLTPPLVTPFFLPPASFSGVPALTPAGQTMTFVITPRYGMIRWTPRRPASWRSCGSWIACRRHSPSGEPSLALYRDLSRKSGLLDLDPVSPMSFGFKWGVKPVFDLKSIGPARPVRRWGLR